MDRGFSLLLYYDKSVPPNEGEIREQLESNDVAEKISGLKTLISLQLQSEQMPRLLMTVIRFVVPSEDHKLKKLLLIYWEVVDKTGPDGQLLPEMILVWCAHPPPLSPSLSIMSTCFHPLSRTAAARPSERA